VYCQQVQHSAVVPAVGSGRRLNDDRSVPHKPPFLPTSRTSGSRASPPRQRPSSKPCPPRQSSRAAEATDRNDWKQSRDVGGKAPSVASTFNDYPNTTYSQTPMAASAEIILNSPRASSRPDNGVQPDEIRSGSSKRDLEHLDRVQSRCSRTSAPFHDGRTTPRDHSHEIQQVLSQHQDGSLQGSRNTTETHSNVPQQGSLNSARHASVSKHNGSMPSYHDPSSHFANVRSFDTIVSTNVSATPHADQCPASTSKSSLNRPEDVRGGSSWKQSSDVGGKAASASRIIPDYPSSTFGQAPLVPSAEFQTTMVTPPLHAQHRDSPDNRTSGYEMQTPVLQQTGSDRCACDHSTPMPSHTLMEQTFPSTDKISRVTSPIRRREDTKSPTANNETSRWNADKTDGCT